MVNTRESTPASPSTPNPLRKNEGSSFNRVVQPIGRALTPSALLRPPKRLPAVCLFLNCSMASATVPEAPV